MEDDKNSIDEQLLGLTLENLKLRGLLEEHLGQRVTEEILGGKVSTKLGGERKRVGIMMPDLRAFTAFSDRVGPVSVVEFLNIFFRMTTACVERHGGFVDKFIGDAILAIFDGNAIAAMPACAREIVRRFDALPPPEGLGLGIGLAAGEVILGYVGSGRKVDFTVIGSPVNLASRLSGLAKAGEILMDAEVRAALEPDAAVRSAGHSAIKGFTQPIEIFRLEPKE